MNSHENERQASVKGLSNFLFGLLLGGLAGAMTMWLLAPSTGKRTRSQIQKQGAKVRHEVAASMEEASDKAHQFTDNVHEGVSELQQNAQDMLGAGKK